EAEERGELSTNHPGATGEVTQIALDLGAESRDLDALQYHPNGGAWPANMQGYSIPETTRAYGATLLNAEREEFTDPLGPRDEVSQAIFDEVAEGRGRETPDGRPAVYLDTTRIPEADAIVSLPYMLRRYRAAGLDPLQERILTYPVLHYQNGGLVIDTEGKTTLDGVYACGEIAGGTHGRNRMMGNSLLECVVFGRRAGRAAAAAARSRSPARGGVCGRAPLRLGAEGHPAGPARRVGGRAASRDVGARQARARDDPPQRQRGRQREEPRLPGHRHRRLPRSRRRALPAPSGADLRGAARRHRERHRRASAAQQRSAHAHAREHRPEHRLSTPDRALGVRAGLGRPRREVRPEGLRQREHELPEDAQPGRRREGDQAVRARLDRRGRRQAVPARERADRQRRLRRLCDGAREGRDHAAVRHAQPRPSRRRARGRAVRAP